MKKTLTLIAAFMLTAAMAKAESTFTGHQMEEAAEQNISDASTDMKLLEGKKALFAAPEKDAKKDAAYWAQAVGSRVKVMAYAQAGYTAKFQEGNHHLNTNTFDMKRVILMVGVNITKDFYGFFMHDFKSGTMQEYYLEYRPMKELNVRFGQSKKELSMENPMSPTVLESIGPMSQSVMALCGGRFDPTGKTVYNGSGRDLGLMVYGDLFNNKLRYVVEVVNGNKINTNDDNTQKDIIAKLEYKPVPNFRISVSGQKGYTGSDELDANGKKTHQRSDRYAVGAEWKSKIAGTNYNDKRCVTVRSEVLGGRDGNNHSFGAYISSAIPVWKRLDAVAMVDYFNRSTELGYKQTNLMGGVQYWMHTKCRLQLQYTYSLQSKALKAVAGGNYSQLQAQVQVAF